MNINDGRRRAPKTRDGISDRFDDAGPVHFPHHALPSLRQQSQNLRLDEHDGSVAKAGRDQVHDVQAG